MPEDVKDVFGQAILDLQFGDTPLIARPFGEGLHRDVWKLVEDSEGDTYRVAYTVALPDAVYVLHAFRKKSTRGRATPRHEIDLVRKRFEFMRAEYARRVREERRGDRT